MTAHDASERRAYHLPPDGYSSPSIDPGCGVCGSPIIFVGVIDGERWMHLITPAERHDVTMPEPWWDVVTGEFVEGNPLLPADRGTVVSGSTGEADCG